MISIQTNVDSLMAQQNLNVDNQFQSNTIQQLTSGYRINSSGDDAAGLAVANQLRSSVTELNQGVLNANNGTSQLQIIDGGLSNISTILDRLKTLATESASSTFTGSRATLNQEYSGLLTEINRQASNINLNAGGSMNTNLSVYIGGATQQANASVNVNLSGAANAVDSTSLGLATTNVLNGGVGVTGNSQRLDAPGATFVKGTAGVNDESFTFNVFANGNAQTVTATVAASTTGSSLSSVLSTLNGQLSQYGITAGTDSNGALQFSGATAFTVQDNGTTATNALTNTNVVSGAATYTHTAASNLTLTNSTTGNSAVIALTSTTTMAQAMAAINAETSTTGVTAVANSAGTGINLVGGGAFTAANSAASGVFGTGAAGTTSSSAAGSGLITNTAVATMPTANDTIVLTNAKGVASTVTLAADTTITAFIADINSQAGNTGITAVANAAGTGINFQGTGAFKVDDVSGDITGTANTTTTATVTPYGSAENSANYTLDGASSFVTQTGNETLQFQTSNGAATVSLTSGDTLASSIEKINAQTSSLGVFAVLNSAGTGISLQGASSFSMTDTNATAAKGFYGAAATATTTNTTATAPTAGTTNNATAAITAINNAISQLGLVQGSVGAGENKLNYATNLAQSQISSYSAAESQIRDANIAAEAADLTKAQVLTQTSVAALAQANSEPQSILKLLQ